MKKAQVTIFIVLGILIIVTIMFLLYVLGIFTSFSLGRNIEDELVAINSHISTCLKEVADQQSIQLAKQAGILKSLELGYRYFNDTEINYLCYNIPGKPYCRNRLLLKQDVESNLVSGINSLLAACINLEEFESSSYSIQKADTWQISADIGDESIRIKMIYPIKLISSNIQLSNEEYNIKLDYPLGSLLKVTNSILAEESSISDFDPLPYMLLHPEYKIIKFRPYPDKIYIIRKSTDSFVFQFAIQGE